jgi:hypothetical protein
MIKLLFILALTVNHWMPGMLQCDDPLSHLMAEGLTSSWF